MLHSQLEYKLLNKNVDGVLALLNAGADPTLTDDWGYTAMHLAAGIEDPKPLQALLGAGVSPDLRNARGRTPIFEAIWHDREPQFRALIAADADLDVQEVVDEFGHPSGDSPLHYAAILGGKRILPLLEAGADPRALNRRGSTFLDYLNVRDESIAIDEFTENKRKIEAWLVEHGVELERKRTSPADSAQASSQAQP